MIATIQGVTQPQNFCRYSVIFHCQKGRCCVHLPITSQKNRGCDHQAKVRTAASRNAGAWQTGALKAGSPKRHTQPCKVHSAITWAKVLLSHSHQRLQFKGYKPLAEFCTSHQKLQQWGCKQEHRMQQHFLDCLWDSSLKQMCIGAL